MGVEPFVLESDTYPGLHKATEECGELLRVIGKFGSTGGLRRYWDGSDLHLMLEDELADVLAALEFVIDHNPRLDRDRISRRRVHKLMLFERWRREQRSGREPQ